MLKKALKKQGITAKVTKSGIAFEIPISGDFRRAKLPPIGKSMGKREHTHSSATDVMDTEIKRKFLKFIICFVSLKFSFCDANYTFSYFHFLFRSYSYMFFYSFVVGEKAALQLERVRCARSRRENAEQYRKGRFMEYILCITLNMYMYVCAFQISAYIKNIIINNLIHRAVFIHTSIYKLHTYNILQI